MEPFVYQHMSEIPYFSLEVWKWEFPDVVAGFSARLPHEDKNRRNYGLHTGQALDQVIQNRQELSEQLGFPLTTWASGVQTHNTNIVEVTEHDRGRGAEDIESAFPQTDGMITHHHQLFLASFYADCVPLYAYSPDTGYIGVAHAGWRGTVAGMALRLVKQMRQKGALKHNIRVAIGPSIGSCCYVVDETVMEPVRQLIASPALRDQMFTQLDQQHFQLDLKQVNKQVFLQAGILPEHIVVSKWCTSCHQQYFYSYRRDRGDTGRMIAWIAKK